MDKYADVFDVRGHKYDNAMRRFPMARDEEFRQLLHGLDIEHCRRVFDIPSGGGYLRRFLHTEVSLVEFDPSADFGLQGGESIDLENLELETASAELVVSLAALHHVANKAGFFRAALSALTPGGYLCVGDVPKGSPLAAFLDDFVGRYNGMGHSGDYLETDADYYRRLIGTGVDLIRCEESPCHWHFDSRADLAAFCKSLFGLVDVSDDEIVEALDRQVGLSTSKTGVVLHWRLQYLQFQVHV